MGHSRYRKRLKKLWAMRSRWLAILMLTAQHHKIQQHKSLDALSTVGKPSSKPGRSKPGLTRTRQGLGRTRDRDTGDHRTAHGAGEKPVSEPYRGADRNRLRERRRASAAGGRTSV